MESHAHRLTCAEQAPQAASRFGLSSGALTTPPAIRAGGHEARVDASGGGSRDIKVTNGATTTACLSASRWLHLLLEARQGAHRMDVNPHFMPQVDACGFHHIGYHHLVPLDDNAYGMRQLASHLGVTADKMSK